MRRAFFAFAFVPLLLASSAFAGDAEVKAAQTVIDGQLKAFIANDGARAYSFAAPNVKQIFPTVDAVHEHGDQWLPAGAQAADLLLRQGRADGPGHRLSSRC